MTYSLEMQYRAERIATALLAHVDERCSRVALCRSLSTSRRVVLPSHVTALWPLIEGHVKAAGLAQGRDLYLVRPIRKMGHMIAVSTDPRYSVWSEAEREKNILTRMASVLHDDSTMRLLAASGDMTIAMKAVRSIDRKQAYMDAYERQKADSDALLASIEAAWVDLPVWVP